MEVKRIIIVVGKYLDIIKIAIGEHYKGIPVSYVIQDNAVGLINAFICGAEKVKDEDVALQLCDEVFFNSYAKEVKEYFKSNSFDFICGVTKDSKDSIKENYCVNTDSEGRILSFIEKPKRIKNDLKGTGFCLFKYDTINYLKNVYSPEDNYPFDLTDYLNELLDNGFCADIKEVAEKEFNVNTVDDLENAEKYIKD